MLQLQTVVFAEPKAGSADGEWEDGAGYDGGDPASGRSARLVVADGATEAYDSIRWVGQLVESFLGLEPAGEPPELTGAGVDQWIHRMQKRWEQEAPARFANVFEERKFREDGSFATLLGCEVRGLGGPRPQWTAVALGDTVLFQVRGLRQVERFPVVEFGINPDGVFTAPAARDRMRAALAVSAGTLAAGDRLYLATDAVAEWMVRAEAADPAALWRTLDRLDPAVFRWLVADRRRAGAMKNDDATLMRVRVTDRDPEHLAVCR